VLARWYHEGLNAFAKNLEGGNELLERFGARVYDLAHRFSTDHGGAKAELASLIEETREAHRDILDRLQHGRDRLLELNSFRPAVAAAIVKGLQRQDEDRSLDDFLMSVFDHFSLNVEELAPRTYKLGSAGVLTDAFPGVPADGLAVTCDRTRALAREDLQFLTWDHPLVTGALDLLLGSEKGNCSVARMTAAKQSGLFLEAVYVLECVAPPHFHADRFLPPTPLRVVVDHGGKDVADAIRPGMLSSGVSNEDAHSLLDRSEIREELLPRMLHRADEIAGGKVQAIVNEARKEMNAQMNHEISRLKELRKVNRSVRAEEIELLIAHQHGLEHHLAAARLRLDAVRLIVA
jgi:ATP-dependent helicase HepA